MKFWEAVTKTPYQVIALLLGSSFVFLGYYEPSDILLGKFTHLPASNTVMIALGLGLILVSITTLIISKVHFEFPELFSPVRLTQTDEVIETELKDAKIRVVFGRLEEIANPALATLVVLPANEFFDDECVRDRNTALGAFVGTKFPGQEGAFLEAVKGQLKGPLVDVERAKGVMKPSYGVGKVAMLERALGYDWNILVAGVTTQRAGEGLRAEMSTVAGVIKEIETAMADRRLSSVYTPMMGAGHGNLRPAAALFALLLGFAEALCRPSGHGIKTVNIVVYRKDAKAQPTLGKATVRRIVKMAVGLYKESQR